VENRERKIKFGNQKKLLRQEEQIFTKLLASVQQHSNQLLGSLTPTHTGFNTFA
jgi:hypothetical protein